MMKKKLLLAFVSMAMVSFAAYSSLQSNENASLSELAIENVDALASEADVDPVNPMCPDGCIDGTGKCFCYIPTTLASFNWGEN